jgi:hypothetical protein
MHLKLSFIILNKLQLAVYFRRRREISFFAAKMSKATKEMKQEKSNHGNRDLVYRVSTGDNQKVLEMDYSDGYTAV